MTKPLALGVWVEIHHIVLTPEELGETLQAAI